MFDYYSGIDIITGLTLIVMVVLIYENNRFNKSTKLKFYMTYGVIFLAMSAEWFGILLNGAPSWTLWIHKIVKSLDYIFTPTVGMFLILQVSEKDRLRKYINMAMLLNIIFQIVSIFTGWGFYIDEENIYHHGPAYPLYMVIYFFTILCVLLEFYSYGRRYTARNKLSLFGVIFLIVTGTLIQEILGFRTFYFTVTVCTILLFIHYTEFTQLANDADLEMKKKLLEKDVLTGLYSRYEYTDDLKSLIEGKTSIENLIVFSIDINELKKVNDTYGHLGGDELIQGASYCIQKVLSPYGKCYRTGGDEFIALLYMEEEKAYGLKLQLADEADRWSGSSVKQLSLSIGYAIEKDLVNPGIEQLIHTADEKMYEEKARFYMQEGKNRRRGDGKRREAVEEKQKEYMDIISALSSDVTGLYMIDRKKREVTAFRISASDHRIRSGVPLKQGFESAMHQFIDNVVHPDDKEMMRKSIQIDFIEKELMSRESIIVHFRSLKNGELHHHYMKCIRNVGDGEFDKIIISFAPEDNIIQMKTIENSLQEIGFDSLTGIYTKQAFLYHAKALLEASPDEDFSIVLSDVLNFKIYNSIYGRNKGDELLKFLADYQRRNVHNGIYARYGADQFIVLLKSMDAEKLQKHINDLLKYVAREVGENVVLKFGIYENVDHSLDISRMCDHAQMALRSIKHTYDHSFAFFDGKVSQQLLKAQTYEATFKSAVANREFVIWYQPKYNPYTEKVVGAEALVRWKKEDGTFIPPYDFISVFEKDGLISQLDEYVFRAVCAHQKKWLDKGVQLIPISVNLSRNSMYQSNVAKKYKMIAEEYGISPKLIPIEITEGTATRTLDIKPMVEQFYEAGFPLHMDDFGSEQSSLAGLNVLHFDVVKLDKSLIDYIGDEHGNLVLMYTMALAKELGLLLVAEGVESDEQVEYLKDNDCEVIQGYYYCKPLPEEEFDKKIAGNLDSDVRIYDYRYKFTASDSVIKRAMDRMIQRMPGGFFTYRCSEDERILSSNEYLWKLFGCKTEEEFMSYVDGSFKGIVCPEDLEYVEEYIQKQINGDADAMDYVEYEIIRKDGTRVQVMDYGHLDHQADGDIFYVFISEKAYHHE